MGNLNNSPRRTLRSLLAAVLMAAPMVLFSGTGSMEGSGDGSQSGSTQFGRDDIFRSMDEVELERNRAMGCTPGFSCNGIRDSKAKVSAQQAAQFVLAMGLPR
ncbi:MAG: hypothetical protein ABW116_12250 [Candidatus Sedimenticola sp. 20ELBAFRAG]